MTARLVVPTEPHVIHGRGTVELFDALTGRLQERVPFENFLSTLALEHTRWKVRQDMHLSMPGSGNTDSTEVFYPFTQIVLTDYAGALDAANEVALRGQLIGWANKTTFAGADAKRGTPNAAESVADNTHAKWVFDWPTNAANGTFQSVCWAQLYSEKNTPDPASYMEWLATHTMTGGTSGTVLGLDYQGGFFWVATTSGARIQKVNPSTFAVDAQTVANPGGFSDPDSCTFDGTNIWMSRQNSTSLYKLDTTGTLLATYVIGSTLRDITFDGTYVCCLCADRTIKRVRTSDGVVNDTISLPTATYFTSASTSAMYGIAWDSDKSRFWVAGRNDTGSVSDPNGNFRVNVLLVDTSGNVDYTFTPFAAGRAFQKNAVFAFDTDGPPGIAYKPGGGFEFYGATGQLNVFHRWRPSGLGTRTLLATPVVKASTQTMKITYDLVFA